MIPNGYIPYVLSHLLNFDFSNGVKYPFNFSLKRGLSPLKSACKNKIFYLNIHYWIERIQQVKGFRSPSLLVLSKQKGVKG